MESKARQHRWAAECTNGVDEEQTDFCHQCLNCGVLAKIPEDVKQPCVGIILARFCGYCDEFVSLEEMKFHCVDPDTEALLCDVKAHDTDNYNDWLKEQNQQSVLKE